MSETDSNIPAGAFSPEDTKTRKTVRLHPAQGGAHLLKQEKIADPLGGRDTDTSNLEILDDTHIVYKEIGRSDICGDGNSYIIGKYRGQFLLGERGRWNLAASCKDDSC